MEIKSRFTVGQVLNFDYDLPSRLKGENRGRRNGDFEVVAICKNDCFDTDIPLIYMKPLSEHFAKEYPNLVEFWQHENFLIERIEEKDDCSVVS